MSTNHGPGPTNPVAGRPPESGRPSGRPEPARMRLFAADSPVVITARELAAAHAGPEGSPCPACGRPVPCATLRNASQVCAAAGVPAPGVRATRTPPVSFMREQRAA